MKITVTNRLLYYRDLVPSPLTMVIASGAIRVGSLPIIKMKLRTENDDPADVLTTINGGVMGTKLTLLLYDATKEITITAGVDIHLAENYDETGMDFILDRAYKLIELECITPGRWKEIGRFSNAD